MTSESSLYPKVRLTAGQTLRELIFANLESFCQVKILVLEIRSALDFIIVKIRIAATLKLLYFKEIQCIKEDGRNLFMRMSDPIFYFANDYIDTKFADLIFWMSKI